MFTHAYPVDLNVHGRTVLVVGLGQVGRRKAAHAIEAGAHVIGVDPGVSKLDRPLGVELRVEPYCSAHLQGVSLAIAAAPPAVNRAVVNDARQAGIWVCSTSDPHDGDFTIPAVWRDGPVVLTVSTSGASPALAAALRDQLAPMVDPAFAGLASLFAELRPVVMAHISDLDARRQLLASWADPYWLVLWRSDGPEAVRKALLRAFETAGDRPR